MDSSHDHHQHQQSQHDEPQVPRTAQEWDERYGGERVWSGNANAVLVTEASRLTPGTALDAGCGEGGDALWLAAHGWQASGIDHSAVGIDRARQAATDAGLEVTWLVGDLVNEAPPGHYDLVTSHFLHLSKQQQVPLFAHLAGAVAPGGHLLVVGHDLSDVHSSVHRPHLEEMGWSADEVAAQLGDGWEVEACEARPRPTIGPDGKETTIRDAVLLARRAS
jgi:SAM-dependent methyltransferase